MHPVRTRSFHGAPHGRNRAPYHRLVDDFTIGHEPVPGRPDASRIELRGELDASTAPPIEEVVEQLLGQGVRLVVVDLTAVSFIDSTAVHTLLVASEQLAATGGALMCAGVSAQVERVLELTGTLELLRRGPAEDAFGPMEAAD